MKRHELVGGGQKPFLSGTGDMVFVGNPAALLGRIDIGDTEATGTMTFDVDRGVTLSSTATGNMTMKTSVTGPSVTMTVTLVTSRELIEYIPGG